MKNWMPGIAAMSLSALVTAQVQAPVAKEMPAAASRDAPAAIDLTKKGAATGLPPAAAAKAKSKAEATKGIKRGDVPTEIVTPKAPTPAGTTTK